MADSIGRPTITVGAAPRSGSSESLSVLEELLENPRGFSFLQAVRLLKQAYGGTHEKTGERAFLRQQLRVRPYLSLGFPPTDLVEVEELPQEGAREPGSLRRFRITATFLGLYGPSSPLPTFYTEELLDEQSEDKSVSRDFVDILNHGFFELFALAAEHYHLDLQACEEGNRDVLQRLFALVGLGHPGMLSCKNPGALLRSTGLLTQFPRSAAGLRSLLSDRIGAPVDIRQCVPRQAAIPIDQRCQLGEGNYALGENIWLGSELAESMGKINIIVGPVDADTFERLIPGEAGHDELLTITRFYCTQPLEFDLEFFLNAQAGEPGRLGEERWSRLGCDMWLASAPLDRAHAIFPDRRRIWDENQRSMVL